MVSAGTPGTLGSHVMGRGTESKTWQRGIGLKKHQKQNWKQREKKMLGTGKTEIPDDL